MNINSTKPLRQMTQSIFSALRKVVNLRKPQRICLDRRGRLINGKDDEEVWTVVYEERSPYIMKRRK